MLELAEIKSVCIDNITKYTVPHITCLFLTT